jgi:SagB-type dehydrogenase family enzyme
MHTLAKLLSSAVGHLRPERASAPSSAVMTLPEPTREGGMPLLQALSERKSGRSFSPQPLSLQVLSNLLWAGFGINRPETGGRTAPSALNAQEVDVYVALASGVYLYASERHELKLVTAEDARRVTGFQPFVDRAPVALIYVADLSQTQIIPIDRRELFAAASAGAIAENVYLYAANAGLTTVVRSRFDRFALASALRLGPDEHVLLAQTVGYPAPEPA